MKGGIPLPRANDVLNQDPDPVQFDERACGPSGEIVVVARGDGNRGDGAEFGNEDGVADVAGVKDVLHAAESFEDPRVEEVVGIRKDADAHGRGGDGRRSWMEEGLGNGIPTTRACFRGGR